MWPVGTLPQETGVEGEEGEGEGPGEGRPMITVTRWRAY